MHQRIGTTIDCIGRDNMIARFAQLQYSGGDRCHSTGCAVCGFGSFDRCKLLTELVDSRIEMPAIQITTFRRRFSAFEKFRHRSRLHDGKRRTGFDGHVDAAVFAEFVTSLSQAFDRVLGGHYVAFMLCY